MTYYTLVRNNLVDWMEHVQLR